jgi:hypothetical protein
MARENLSGEEDDIYKVRSKKRTIWKLELGTRNWLNHRRFNPDVSTGRRHILSIIQLYSFQILFYTGNKLKGF